LRFCFLFFPSFPLEVFDRVVLVLIGVLGDFLFRPCHVLGHPYRFGFGGCEAVLLEGLGEFSYFCVLDISEFHICHLTCKTYVSIQKQILLYKYFVCVSYTHESSFFDDGLCSCLPSPTSHVPKNTRRRYAATGTRNHLK